MKDEKLVLPRSPIALTEAIKEMIGNPMKAAKLEKDTREKIKKEFSIEKTAKGYGELYTRLVS